MAHEPRYVARPLAEGRQRNRDDVEPEKEIFAKRSFVHAPREVLVRRRQNAHVDADRLTTTDALDLFRFDRTKQFGLRLGTEVSDFVEEERSSVRELEAPNAAVRCPGERPLFVPEHLALDELAWYRRAVDPNERPVAPRACPVNRRRDELLSRP